MPGTETGTAAPAAARTMRAVTKAQLLTPRWIRWNCPHDEATGCGFTFALPDLELTLSGDSGPLASEPVTLTYGDHAAQQEFFAAVQAEHERRDHAGLAEWSAEREALVERLSTGLGIPSPRRSTASARVAA